MALLAGALNGVAKNNWEPIPAADLATKESVSSPGADVEILLSREVVESNFRESKLNHYVRAKIYTAKGAEDWGKYRAETAPLARVKYMAGRVIKADGTIIELEKSDFHETVLLKYDNEKWRQTAFAFPNLAPGDIVECQWTEEFKAWLSSVHSFFQENFPVREFQFRIDNFPTQYWVEWQNCTTAKLESKDRSQMTLVVRNIPPFEKEEFMPPEWEFRGGVLLIPNDGDHTSAEALHLFSRGGAEGFRDMTKPGGLKKKAAALVAGAKTDDEKIQRLYEFCQTQIDNLSQSDTPQAKAAREQRNEERNQGGYANPQSAVDTLEKGAGWPYEINYLFAGLARAAGFEVKGVESASRDEVLNVKTEKGWIFLNRMSVGVQVAGVWRSFSPGSYWVPYGMLEWTDEGVTGLWFDDDKIQYEDTPATPAEKSQAARKGRFTLDAEGTLDGEVEQVFTGHEGIELKSKNTDKAADEVDRDFRALIVQRLPTAEITDLHWENLRTHDFPVTAHYKIHIPGYAEQAGKRLVMAPGFFETGRPEVFAAEKRTLPIFFPFAREEHDDIEIILPEGFELDHPSAPANVAAQEKTIGARYQISYKPKSRTLSYKRDFVLGGNQAIAFRAESYPVLKQRFEKLHQSDTHTIILKPKAETAPTPPPANPAPTGAGP